MQMKNVYMCPHKYIYNLMLSVIPKLMSPTRVIVAPPFLNQSWIKTEYPIVAVRGRAVRRFRNFGPSFF